MSARVRRLLAAAAALLPAGIVAVAAIFEGAKRW
jgi:hypothetical protein